MKRTLILSAAILASAYTLPRLAVPILRANLSRPEVVSPAPSVEQRIVAAALAVDLPPSIALKRFWAESRLIHSMHGVVLESAGNCGIAQLNRRWTKDACRMTEAESIAEGVRQLAAYWEEFHDERLVRVAYTAGVTTARRNRHAK